MIASARRRQNLIDRVVCRIVYWIAPAWTELGALREGAAPRHTCLARLRHIGVARIALPCKLCVWIRAVSRAVACCEPRAQRGFMQIATRFLTLAVPSRRQAQPGYRPRAFAQILAPCLEKALSRATT